jgi:hypothetical protein
LFSEIGEKIASQDNTKRIINRITTFKRIMKMKKILLTVVAAMAFTLSFAETKSNSVDTRYDMSCDMRRLSVLLDLNEWQMDAVEVIHNTFSDDMQALATVKGPRQRHLIRRALSKDAQQMKYVLNDKQLNTYMRLMLVTLRNRKL